MLVNGLFNKDQGGWVIDGVGPVEKGCAATTGNVLKRRHPSLGHAFESTLTFGRDPSSVSQAITVPTPGTVTFAVTLAKLPPNQQMVIRIATAQNFPKVVATKTGTYSVSLVTTSPQEVVTVRIIVDQSVTPPPGCAGMQVKDAKLTYVQTNAATTVAPTTTTTPVAKCGGTVKCAVGSVGPGTGLVYLVDQNQPSGYNRYFELAPPKWDGSTAGDPLLTVDEAYRQVEKGVKSSAGQVVGTSAWASDNELDWRVPTRSELQDVYNSPNKGGIARGEYLSSTRASLSDPSYFFLNFETGAWRTTSIPNWRNEKGLVRPVRRGPSPCALGGACAIGDVGPAGGKVFYVASKDKPIVTNRQPCMSGSSCIYMEVAPPNWSGGTTDPQKLWAQPVQGCCKEVPNQGAKGSAIGTGAQNTWNIMVQQQAYDSAAKAASVDYKWYLPSLEELFEVYIQRNKVDAPASGEYWSSTEAGQHAAIAIDFSSTFPVLPDQRQAALSTVQHTIYKDTNWRGVRPVRAFAPACPCK